MEHVVRRNNHLDLDLLHLQGKERVAVGKRKERM